MFHENHTFLARMLSDEGLKQCGTATRTGLLSCIPSRPRYPRWIAAWIAPWIAVVECVSREAGAYPTT
jgi:hypothetical protein